jgi:DNA-binding transcriptional LysR family regulator
MDETQITPHTSVKNGSVNARIGDIYAAPPEELVGAASVVVECAHRAAIYELVQHGAGAALLPRRFADTELTGVVVRSTVPRMSRSIGLVLRPGPLSPAAAAFLEVAASLHPSPGERNERLAGR